MPLTERKKAFFHRSRLGVLSNIYEHLSAPATRKTLSSRMAGETLKCNKDLCRLGIALDVPLDCFCLRNQAQADWCLSPSHSLARLVLSYTRRVTAGRLYHVIKWKGERMCVGLRGKLYSAKSRPQNPRKSFDGKAALRVDSFRLRQ